MPKARKERREITRTIGGVFEKDNNFSRTNTPDNYLPAFDFKINSHKSGYFTRGHRELNHKYRGADVFQHALRKLEAHETKLFQKGKFEEYRATIKHEILTSAPYIQFIPNGLAAEITKIIKPTHLDFSSTAKVTARMMEFDYSMHPFSIRQLRAFGFSGEETHENIIRFLRTTEGLDNKTVFLVTKPAKIENPK
ncbi:MAG: hypothetical protein NUV57_01565 [archaeon]|nr:hypothetical protein [archaeon]